MAIAFGSSTTSTFSKPAFWAMSLRTLKDFTPKPASAPIADFLSHTSERYWPLERDWINLSLTLTYIGVRKKSGRSSSFIPRREGRLSSKAFSLVRMGPQFSKRSSVTMARFGVRMRSFSHSCLKTKAASTSTPQRRRPMRQSLAS